MTRSLREEARKAASILLEAVTPKDSYTSEHALKVDHLSRLVGVNLGLSEQQLETLELGALLHDLGKIGVPDAILEKPGPLTEEEWAAVKRPPGVGAQLIEPLEILSR